MSYLISSLGHRGQQLANKAAMRSRGMLEDDKEHKILSFSKYNSQLNDKAFSKMRFPTRPTPDSMLSISSHHKRSPCSYRWVTHTDWAAKGFLNLPAQMLLNATRKGTDQRCTLCFKGCSTSNTTASSAEDAISYAK